MLSIMLFIVAIGIGYSGIKTIITKEYNTPGILAIVGAVISIVTKEWMYFYTIKYSYYTLLLYFCLTEAIRPISTTMDGAREERLISWTGLLRNSAMSVSAGTFLRNGSTPSSSPRLHSLSL